jgi:hypothetical protein
LKNLSALLERLRKAQIPNATYRLYYQEPGLPPQQVLEFRKTGNAIGDPVREPGRGTNPIENQPNPAQPAAPAGDPNAVNPAMGQIQLPVPAADQYDLESAITQVAQQSFSRAARLLRSWLR